MLPKLKPHEAYMLASQFDLSGGEIENIIRKHTVQTILSAVVRSMFRRWPICADRSVSTPLRVRASVSSLRIAMRGECSALHGRLG